MLLLTKYTVLYKENEICCIILPSLPSRERGLKSYACYMADLLGIVAPFAGAWIEITVGFRKSWNLKSLPSRERGLKFLPLFASYVNPAVAPFAGAWIEIWYYTWSRIWVLCRSLRGSVD